MYTKRIYSPAIMLNWTREELILFAVLSAIPVFLYDVLDQKWMHFPWLPVALVGTAVAFILGFQNNATYDRIWEARKIWGGIVNTSRTWAIMVNDFITNELATEKARDSELREIKQQLVRNHAAWLTALRHSLRSSRPWEQFTKHRTNREWSRAIQVREHHMTLDEEIGGYLDPAEQKAVLSKANPAAQILALQSHELRRLRARGLIDDFRHMEMMNVLSRLYDGQGKAERIKNFPYPRQYATLNTVLLWIFLVLIPFGLVFELDNIGQEIAPEHPLMGRYFVWLTVPFSVIVMWVFHTMERIGRVGENPFEGSANDVPITTMARAIEIDMRQIIDDDPSAIPEPIEQRRATQM